LREDGHVAEAAVVLREALELWRGGAMSDLVHEPCLRSEIAQLEELRVVALEGRIDADLERGRADELIAELGGDARPGAFAARMAVGTAHPRPNRGRHAGKIERLEPRPERLRSSY
jgi:hypothetical protein